jgi:hypothetical protein
MLYNYAYVSTASAVNNYDSTEWSSELTLSKQVGIYLNDEIEISEVIKNVCIAEDGIFLVMDDGRFTFRHETPIYIVDRVIQSDEWLDEPNIEYKREEYLSKLTIQYDKNQSESTGWRSYTDTNYESTSYEKFKTYADKTINTVITSTSDVYDKAESVMVRSKDIVQTVTRKLKQQHIDLDIMDIIACEHGRYSDSELEKPWALYRLIGIQKDLNNAQLTWTMRWLQNCDFLIADDGDYLVGDGGDYLIGG